MTLNTTLFIERARDVHGNKYDYSRVEYTGVHNKELVGCPVHGSFSQSYELHIRRKQGCPECGRERQKISKRTTLEEFIRQSNITHTNKYNYHRVQPFATLREKVTIVCPTHGEFIQRAYSHMLEGKGCQKCFRLRRRLTTDEFIQKSNNIHDHFYNYRNTEYTTCDALIEIECPDHGTQQLRPIDHYRVGCFSCRRRKMEHRWLTEMGIPNDRTFRQVRLNIEGQLFIVDGFDPTTNTVYLFHGDFWHGNPRVFDPNDINPKNGKTFKLLYEETLDYEQKLRDNGYNIVVEWEYNWRH